MEMQRYHFSAREIFVNWPRNVYTCSLSRSRLSSKRRATVVTQCALSSDKYHRARSQGLPEDGARLAVN